MNQLNKAPVHRQLNDSWRRKRDEPQADATSCEPVSGRSQLDEAPTAAYHQAGKGTDRPAFDTRVYIGNLLYTLQRDDVMGFFIDNGFQPSGISMSIDPFTGRNPSYAFVDLSSPEEASRAIETLNGLHLGGRPVKLNAGLAKSKRGNSEQSRVRDYASGWGKRQKFGHVQDYVPTFDRWDRNDAPTHFVAPVKNEQRLWVGGLPRIEPQAAVDAEIQQLFSGFELTTVSKIVSPSRANPNKASEYGNQYYCFVDLATKEDADRAVQQVNKRKGSWGGSVTVQKAIDNAKRKVIREQLLDGDQVLSKEPL